MNVAPMSEGKISHVKRERVSDTLGIGAFNTRVSLAVRVTTAILTSAFIYTQSGEQHPRDDAHSPTGRSSPVSSAGAAKSAPPVNSQIQRRYSAIWQ